MLKIIPIIVLLVISIKSIGQNNNPKLPVFDQQNLVNKAEAVREKYEIAVDSLTIELQKLKLKYDSLYTTDDYLMFNIEIEQMILAKYLELKTDLVRKYRNYKIVLEEKSMLYKKYKHQCDSVGQSRKKDL